MSLLQKTGSCWPPSSLAYDLQCGVCVCLLISSHPVEGFQSTSITCIDMQVYKGRIRMWKEVGWSRRVAKKDRWRHPEIDEGHREGPTCFFQRRQRTKERIRKEMFNQFQIALRAFATLNYVWERNGSKNKYKSAWGYNNSRNKTFFFHNFKNFHTFTARLNRTHLFFWIILSSFYIDIFY